MRTLHNARTALLILLVAFGCAVVSCLLPEDPYQRWQLLDGTIHANARWIYERTKFDPRPIDVVFVGPSRTGAGINAPRLSAALATRGLPSNVVNFSFPESGRNINYAVVEQLLRHKTPKLLVLGVTEKPSRFGHSAFKFIAPPEMIVAPGYWFDLNYFSDLIYLPYRQLRLFFEDVAPSVFGGDKQFARSNYRGPSIDTTGSLTLPGGIHKEGDLPASAHELARGVHKLEAGENPPILPARYADIEFGDERHYIRRIAALARAKGVKIAFIALPYYTGPSTLQEFAFYRRFGPVWNAGYVSSHAEWYSDYGHLTRTGAEHVTDWLTPLVAAQLTPDAPAIKPAP